MTLDADTVLWALRGMHDPQHEGLRAEEVAKFISKDATLTGQYRSCDVTVVLESLVADGTVTHALADDDLLGDESAPATTLYRLSPDADPLSLQADMTFPADFGPLVLVKDTSAELNAVTVLDAPRVGPYLHFQADELQRERDALIEERDSWRERAEREMARSLKESGELRARIRELETLLESLMERERALELKRSETTSRVVTALTQARDELEHLFADDRVQASETSHRRPRGNWLA